MEYRGLRVPVVAVVVVAAVLGAPAALGDLHAPRASLEVQRSTVLRDGVVALRVECGEKCTIERAWVEAGDGSGALRGVSGAAGDHRGRLASADVLEVREVGGSEPLKVVARVVDEAGNAAEVRTELPRGPGPLPGDPVGAEERRQRAAERRRSATDRTRKTRRARRRYADYLGTWSGRIQPEGDDAYPVRLTLELAGDQLRGSANYPSFPCRGAWEQVGTNPVTMSETVNNDNCRDTDVVVRRRSDGRLLIVIDGSERGVVSRTG